MKSNFRFISLGFLGLLLIHLGVSACGSSGGANTFTLNLTVGGAGSGSVTSDTGGINCNDTGGSCSATYDANTVVSLTATPASGYVFKAWSGGGCSGAGACQVTITEATSVRATFTLIVFSSNLNLSGSASDTANDSYNIWVVKTDGTGLEAITRVTAAGAGSHEPEWSPDGEQIVFFSIMNLDGGATSPANDAYNIWVVNSDGSDLTPLTQTTASGVETISPEWSPDGEQIAFYSNMNISGSPTDTANATYNVWVINRDGSNLDPLTETTANNALSISPQWSPNGEQIVFSSLMNLDGSPTGTSNGFSNIWLMNSDGTNKVALTQITAPGTANAISPQWSPDGTSIAFSSTMSLDGNPLGTATSANNIWLIDADRSNLTALTQTTAASASSSTPSWSPNGDLIVFTSLLNLDGSTTGSPNNNENIWLINSDGTNLNPLTTTNLAGGSVLNPHWSPNGEQIIFTSTFNTSNPIEGSPGASYNIWLISEEWGGELALTEIDNAGLNILQATF